MATPLTLQSGVGSNSAGGALTLLPGISEGTNKAGANLTLNGGQGTGTGTGGSIIFKVADGGIGSSANTNTLQKALEIKDNGEIVSSGSHYIASAANASWGGLEVSPTLTFTGSTSVTNASPINMVSLSAPTLFCGSAINVDTAASLYVAGAPSTGGSLTISNSYSLFVDAGTTRLDGGLNLAGTLVTATAAELNLVYSSSAGTIVNSKAVIYGASGEVNATTLQIGGSSITSTATELNILDGDASPGTDAVSGSDGIVVNDGGTMKQTTVDTFDTYLSGTTKTLTNKTLISPNINTSIIPVSADGAALGSDTKEWSDLYLADGSVIYFGNDQDVTLTHVADEGLALKHTATGDDKPIKLTLQTGETDIAIHDKIGVIDFQAPDEGTGTDSRLVCAGIEAVSEGDFAANNNATKLSFKTAASETASEKMKLSSAGVLTVNNTIESGVSSSTTGSLKLYSSGNGNTTTISAATTPTSSVNYVLPDNAPPTADQHFLSSTTNGVMSWATNGLGGGGGGGDPVSSTSLIDATTNGGSSIIIDAGGGLPTTTNAAAIYNVGFGHTIFGSATNTFTTGKGNTIMGYSIAPSISTGSSNTLIGSFSGGSLSSGIRNTFIGSASGGTGGDTGTNNTCLGYGATVSASDVDNEITLGNNAVTDLRCADTTIASLSDERDKTDIIDLPWGLDFIDSLRPVQFTWDRRVLTPDDENWPMNGKKRAGFIAQDLQSSMTDNANEVLDLVYTSNPERLEVKQGKLVPILTQAIKELKAELDTLKAEVAALKNASN